MPLPPVIPVATVNSWADFVIKDLIKEGIKCAAIFGFHGYIYAKSANFNYPTDELLQIFYGFTDTDNLLKIGVWIDGQKYVPVKADEHIIHGRKSDGGVMCAKTASAVVIGLYDDENIQTEEACNLIERLGKKLITSGY